MTVATLAGSLLAARSATTRARDGAWSRPARLATTWIATAVALLLSLSLAEALFGLQRTDQLGALVPASKPHLPAAAVAGAIVFAATLLSLCLTRAVDERRRLAGLLAPTMTADTKGR